jgi:RNA polymerase sigma-70 factor, ECF subfamily
MSDHRNVRNPTPHRAPADTATRGPVRGGAPLPTAAQSDDTRLAVEIRELVERGEMDDARERFAGLVAVHQRRAIRIAFQYLRDSAEADEAVQDAFVKVFTHIGSYREAWPFEVWFTRILINGCLDRRKARARRDRWFVAAEDHAPHDPVTETVGGTTEPDPEERLLARERHGKLAATMATARHVRSAR